MRSVTGTRGEELAAHHLRALGWSIVERNWRCSQGELDLVALEPQGCVVAVEVKTRTGTMYGDPLEAITTNKLRRLHRLAARWYREHPGVGTGLRLDAVGIVKQIGMAPQITHVRGL